MFTKGQQVYTKMRLRNKVMSWNQRLTIDKARNTYTCFDCGTPIGKGTLHARRRTLHFCLNCVLPCSESGDIP